MAPALAPPFAKRLNRASVADTLLAFARIILPTVGKGIILRRPAMEAAAERFGFDDKAALLMRQFRRKYGPEPLLLRIPFRPHILLLDARDVATVLDHSPEPFATDTKEKRQALAHFEPGNVLISGAPDRRKLRPLHETALATGSAVHPLSTRFRTVVGEELGAIAPPEAGELAWDVFSNAWSRIVRRIVLGDVAGGDEELTRLLNKLRGRANWAFLAPKDRKGRDSFLGKLRSYIDRPDPLGLAGRLPRRPDSQPASQVAQWLFAFDPAGMATFRTLALLACHAEFSTVVRREADDGLAMRADGSFTRRCFMESLRLWPTTPAILRQTDRDIDTESGRIGKGTGIIVFTPFFHRDEEALADAHRMNPEIWQGADSIPAKGLVPFSAGPAICPAHNLVPLVATFAIWTMLAGKRLELVTPKMDPQRLPGTLDHFRIVLRASVA
jgi:cytochrome P450